MGVRFKGRVLFKRWSSFILSVLVSFFFGALVFGLGVVSPEIDDANFGDLAFAVFIISLISIFVWFIFNLAVFPGVDVKSDRVVVKKFMGEVEISLGAISGIEWSGGIGVRLKNGVRVNCVAFPNSLYSFLIGYRNFRRVALSLEGVLADRSKDGGVWAFEKNSLNLKSLFLILIFFTLNFAIARLVS